jgi:hypothetical protein
VTASSSAEPREPRTALGGTVDGADGIAKEGAGSEGVRYARVLGCTIRWQWEGSEHLAPDWARETSIDEPPVVVAHVRWGEEGAEKTREASDGEPAAFFGTLAWCPGPEGITLRGSRSSARIDPTRGTIVAVASDAREAELQALLAVHACLHARERYALHAAAFEDRGRGVLAVGGSGSGKSTLAVGFGAAGALIATDDCAYLNRGQDCAVRAGGLLRDLRLGDLALGAHRALAGAALGRVRGEMDKTQIDAGVLGRRVVSEHAVDVVLFPRVVDRALTKVTPLEATDAFVALVASSPLIVAPGSRNRDPNVDLLAQLAETSRAFEVELGRDLICAPLEAVERIRESTA